MHQINETPSAEEVYGLYKTVKGYVEARGSVREKMAIDNVEKYLQDHPSVVHGVIGDHPEHFLADENVFRDVDENLLDVFCNHGYKKYMQEFSDRWIDKMTISESRNLYDDSSDRKFPKPTMKMLNKILEYTDPDERNTPEFILNKRMIATDNDLTLELIEKVDKNIDLTEAYHRYINSASELDVAVIDAFKEHGVDLNAKRGEIPPAMLYLNNNPNPTLNGLRLLKNFGVNVIAQNEKGNPLNVITARMIKANNNQDISQLEKIAISFRDMGMNPNSSSADKNVMAIVKAMEDKQGVYYNKDKKQEAHCIQTFDMLKRIGVDITALDKNGDTVLHKLARNPETFFLYPETIKNIAQEIGPDIKNRNGQTVMEVLQDSIQKEMEKYRIVNGLTMSNLLDYANTFSMDMNEFIRLDVINYNMAINRDYSIIYEESNPYAFEGWKEGRENNIYERLSEKKLTLESYYALTAMGFDPNEAALHFLENYGEGSEELTETKDFIDFYALSTIEISKDAQEAFEERGIDIKEEILKTKFGLKDNAFKEFAKSAEWIRDPMLMYSFNIKSDTVAEIEKEYTNDFPEIKQW